MAPALQELPVKLGRQAHVWTMLLWWEPDAVMAHAVPGECEHWGAWAAGGQRQGVPSSLSGILHTEQTLLKLKTKWKECAVLSQANCNYLLYAGSLNTIN